MERRMHLSKEELEKVIELREIGVSWLKIQQETSINRRTAKKAYEDWERRQSKEKLQQARVQVGTQIFREHLECIVTVALALVDNLPESMVFFETRDAETVLRQIWMRDIVGHVVRTGGSWERIVSMVPFERLPDRQKQRIFRQNRMLFQCLKEHTQAMRWQKVLEKWRCAWEERMGILTELHSKAERMVRQEVENWHKMEKREQVERSIPNMARGVVEAVWLGALDEPEKSYRFVRAKVDHIEFGGETQVLLEDKNLAEELAKLCRRVVKNVVGPQEKSLVKNPMKTAVEQLEQELDPYILRPIILKTECSQCPA